MSCWKEFVLAALRFVETDFIQRNLRSLWCLTSHTLCMTDQENHVLTSRAAFVVSGNEGRRE
jgi:hypothetical protein